MNTGLIERIRNAETMAAEMVAQEKARAEERLQELREIQKNDLKLLESLYTDKRKAVPDLARDRAERLLTDKREDHERIMAAIRQNGETHREEAVQLLISTLLE